MIENLTKLPSPPRDSAAVQSAWFELIRRHGGTLFDETTDVASLLYELLGPPSSESLPSGTVRLLIDDNFQGPGLDLSIYGFLPNARHTIPSNLLDNATYIMFNLPIGTVMTFMDHVTPVGSDSPIADLRGCGACVDLVGTGQIEYVDLRPMDMNDGLSSFFWREVDFNLGAIELFTHSNFQGSRCTLFLSEWAPDKIHSISEWWLQDSISSARWKALTDLQTVQLFEHDGTGNSYNNIVGYGEDWRRKELADFGDIQLNDGISSFSWSQLTPKKEIIKPFQINSKSMSGSYGITQTINGTNQGDTDKGPASEVTVEINKQNVETITVTTTNNWVTGVKAAFSKKVSSKLADIGSEYTWSVELSFSYARTETRSTTYSEAISVKVAQKFVPLPNTTYTATLTANIGKFPETVYNTTAERWYDRPVTGAVRDPDNNNLYKRTEPVSVTIAGGLCTDVIFDVSSQKIPKSSQP